MARDLVTTAFAFMTFVATFVALNKFTMSASVMHMVLFSAIVKVAHEQIYLYLLK